jgi:cyclohexyl-isocyanide hydratase
LAVSVPGLADGVRRRPLGSPPYLGEEPLPPPVQTPPALRRREVALLGAMASLLAGQAAAGAGDPEHGDAAHRRAMRDAPKLTCGLLLFHDFTALDLVAPQLLMATMMNTEVHLVAASETPVMSGSGLAIVPTKTYRTCPKDLDILFVPGGPAGTPEALQDDVLLDFLADRGSRARFVTSVCTGSVLLGAAGLLEGYAAASYWATRDLLPLFGARPRDERVVIDRNRITGGGITAGIDFGLVLTARLRGESVARLQALLLEYDPQPPYRGGTPKTARADTVELARNILDRELREIRTTGDRNGSAGPR